MNQHQIAASRRIPHAHQRPTAGREIRLEDARFGEQSRHTPATPVVDVKVAVQADIPPYFLLIENDGAVVHGNARSQVACRQPT
jgi:hypothetical protein